MTTMNRYAAILLLPALLALPLSARTIDEAVRTLISDPKQLNNIVPAHDRKEQELALFGLFFLAKDKSSGLKRLKSDPVPGALIPSSAARMDGCDASTSVAIEPTERFVYANVSSTHGFLCGYVMDKAAGTLTPVPGMPFAAGKDPATIAIDPVGAFLYVANYTDETISAYTIDADTGALGPVAGSPFAGGPSTYALAVEARGKYVYSAGTPLKQTVGSITASAIDRATGALTPVPGSPFATVDNPLALAADPTGKYLYASGNGLQAYSINSANGALTPIGTTHPAGRGTTVDPSGRFVYSINFSEGIQAFAIGADGTLTPIGTPRPAGSNPVNLTITKSGRFLYAANLISGDISGYAIDLATGALTELPGSPYPAGENVFALATSGAMPSTERATLGVAYSNKIQAAGGRPLYTWSVIAGTLPPGLALNAATGMVTGTPTVAGTYPFTVQVTDSLGRTDNAAITTIVDDGAAAPNYQGLWWNAPAGSESGWGINLAHQRDTIFATWFTFGLDGKPVWLVVAANRTSPGVYGGTLYTGTGPAFNAVPFNPASVAPVSVGTATFSFTGADNATFDYTVQLAGMPAAVAQTKQITRQVFAAPVPACAWGAQNPALATNFQDIWWNSPAGSESGWGVNFNHQGDTIFATWFTFGLDGKPVWLVAAANKTAPNVYGGTLYSGTGPAFNSVPFNSAVVSPVQVGSIVLTFTDGNAASFNYTVQLPGMPGAVSQTKSVTRQVFVAPGTVCY